jgi:N-acetyl-gamma-glutamyl-phosphate reductase
MTTNINIAIVGASGYSGEELIRLLLRHPRARIVAFTSRQHAGKRVADVFPRFRGQIDANFVEPTPKNLRNAKPDAVFLALPHGVSTEFVPPLLENGVKIFDLSADFRLKSAEIYEEFYGAKHPAPQLLQKSVYGLPELHRAEIKKAQLVACPGCYPTSIILGATPALSHKIAKPDGIVVASMSGVTGAGRKVADEFLFSECNESVRAYGIPKHRHLSEIEQELSGAAKRAVKISFTPHLVPINRGISSTIVMDFAGGDAKNLKKIYAEFYKNEPFVRVLETIPDTKNVEMTNFCDIAVRFDARTNKIVVVSVIDNLTKGAAGQAVQCLNIAFGFEESAGLL